MADDDIDNLDFLPQELMGGGMMGGPGGMMGGMMGGMGLAALADPRIKDGTASRWVCVYPVYFDQDKSWEEGRRVPKAAAVKDPAAVYIHRAVEMLGLEAAVEPARRHPRDAFTFGRIRVQLRTSDGRALNSTCTTKKQLLLRIASLLPAVVVALDADGPHHAETAATSRS
ncbi:signal recognition particle, SRP19 subunit, partial [Entophlyctis helioformis]